jgi:hypothetical protein
LAIENMPTRWKIVPLHEDEFEGSRFIGSSYEDDYREFIPDVDYDLLAEVCHTLELLPQSFHIAITLGKGEDKQRGGHGDGRQSKSLMYMFPTCSSPGQL